MSLIQYILDSVHKRLRAERVEVKFACSYHIYHQSEHHESYPDLEDGTIINISHKGFGMITAPAFEDSFKSTLKKKEHKIYLEAYSPENNTNLKMHGEIRWVRSVKNIQKPYSEIGILLTSVKDDSKTEILDSLFDPTKNV